MWVIGTTNLKTVINPPKTLKIWVLQQQLTMQLIPQIHQVYACPDCGQSMLVINRNHWSIFEGKFPDTRNEADKNIIPPPKQYKFDLFAKPGIGMIQYFRFTHNQPTEEILFGYRQIDLEAAQKAGIKLIWADQ